jgi:hypothetical protein
MSDIDPDLPDYLVDAILSKGPAAEDVDLVKNAFTWRTIDAELMELTYDSVLDTTGVRDASARRTMEFTAGDLTIVIEIEAGTIRGQVRSSGAGLSIQLVGQDATVEGQLSPEGAISFASLAPGSYRLELLDGEAMHATPTFTVG